MSESKLRTPEEWDTKEWCSAILDCEPNVDKILERLREYEKVIYNRALEDAANKAQIKFVFYTEDGNRRYPYREIDRESILKLKM